jgi:hemerythrin-like domain-containing protein
MQNTLGATLLGVTIRRQHEVLQKMMARAQQLCARPQLNSAELWACFTALAHAIETHFATEETEGLFDQLLADAPQRSVQIAALRAEHGALQTMIGQLAEETKQLTFADRLPEQFSKTFSEFHSRFMRHEMTEDELIEDVYTSDHGIVD